MSSLQNSAQNDGDDDRFETCEYCYFASRGKATINFLVSQKSEKKFSFYISDMLDFSNQNW